MDVFGISIYLLLALVCGIVLIILAFMGLDFGGDFDTDVGGGLGADGASGVEHFEGGHGDFSGAHLSPLSLPLVLAFFTSFGALAALFEGMEYAPLYVPTFAIFLSLAICLVLYLVLDRGFYSTQASSSIKYNKLVGRDATVTIPIKRGTQGQVMVITEARGRTLLTAISSEDIPTNATVLIEDFSGGSLIVKRKNI
jgi:membrane protein implicated in regulation of membrane protease activity